MARMSQPICIATIRSYFLPERGQRGVHDALINAWEFANEDAGALGHLLARDLRERA